MIDLDAVRALITVDREGTVAAAADALGFTPSAVSQQLKRLERQLGVPVLERVGRRVVLSAAGAALVAEGGRLIEDAETLAARVRREASSLRTEVTLAAFSTSVRGLVAGLAAGLRTSTPELALTVIERDPPEAADMVLHGRATLALVHNWVGVPLHLPEGLRSRPVADDVADVLVHAGHPLAGHGYVTPQDLIAERWTSTEPGTICHAWFRQMFAGFPRPPRVDFWAGEFQSQVALVEAGVAVALVPRLGRGALPQGVVAVGVRDPVPTRQITAVWRASGSAHPAVGFLVDELVRLGAPASAPV